MALYIRKEGPIEARQWNETRSLTVVNDKKGQQIAKKGDWLLGSERGKISVLSDREFAEEYELYTASTAKRR